MFYQIASKKSSIRRQLDVFKACINSNLVRFPPIPPQLIFLCGGNRKISPTTHTPSFRRAELITFLKEIENVHAFLAEGVLSKLSDKETRKNIYEIEKDLFQLCDYVLLVLESNSTYCELGAFAHTPELRKKIIVVNDSKYANTPSFITTGPISLIQIASNEKNILWYPMDKNISRGPDAIGTIFDSLEEIIKDKFRQKSSPASIDLTRLEKNSLFFLKDLVTLFGPLTGKEIIKVLAIIFKKQDYAYVHIMLALLQTLNFLTFDNGYYRALNQKLFFNYNSVRVPDLLAATRLYALREARL